MQNRVIPNPIINSPFEEPRRHFQFDEEGITDHIVEQRRKSSYFVPIARPKKKPKDKQLVLDTEWTADRIEENKAVNSIREVVTIWRDGGYQETTGITRRLLEHWKLPDRYRRLFFCQIEALETLIYITEAAHKFGDQWITNDLKQFAAAESYSYCIWAIGSAVQKKLATLLIWARSAAQSFRTIIAPPHALEEKSQRHQSAPTQQHYCHHWPFCIPCRVGDCQFIRGGQIR